MIEEVGYEERKNRREKQQLLEQNNRLKSLAQAYREIADVRESKDLINALMSGARILAKNARIGLIERGAIVKSEDRLGPCDMTPNPDWRIVSIGEGHSKDLIAPLYDGRGLYLCGVMGASRRILYLDDLEIIDESLINDFTSFVRFSGVAISALTSAERDRLASVTDALTDLPNRRALEKIVERMISDNRNFAYVIIDLDNFKQINDKQGHGAGDLLLQKVGKVLKEHTRANDFPSRLAGDEFVVLLGTGDTVAGATRVREWLEKNGIKSSTGVARYPEDGKTSQELYTAADKKLYINKDERRAAGLR